MSMRDMGGPAYPVNDHSELLDEGMTLWDYYAAAALSRLADTRQTNDLPLENARADNSARLAAKYADAMLEERDERIKN